jgi:hypothetical protein
MVHEIPSKDFQSQSSCVLIEAIKATTLRQLQCRAVPHGNHNARKFGVTAIAHAHSVVDNLTI